MTADSFHPLFLCPLSPPNCLFPLKFVGTSPFWPFSGSTLPPTLNTASSMPDEVLQALHHFFSLCFVTGTPNHISLQHSCFPNSFSVVSSLMVFCLFVLGLEYMRNLLYLLKVHEITTCMRLLQISTSELNCPYFDAMPDGFVLLLSIPITWNPAVLLLFPYLLYFSTRLITPWGQAGDHVLFKFITVVRWTLYTRCLVLSKYVLNQIYNIFIYLYILDLNPILKDKDAFPSPSLLPYSFFSSLFPCLSISSRKI